MLRVELFWPHKALWPNGGQAHRMKASSEKKKARNWAIAATMEAQQKGGGVLTNGDATPIPVCIVVHAKARGPLPDNDNVIAASKAMIDGIAHCLGINDRHFAAPTVRFETPRNGTFFIEIGN